MTVSSAHAVELRLGEKISQDGLELFFYDIEDSRCPLDMTCVWEGEVTAKITMQNQTHEISHDFNIDSAYFISPYEVILIDVVPRPVTTLTPNYVAVLDVVNFSHIGKIESESKENPPPLKQFENNTPFSEIKCNTGLQLTQRHDGTPACVKSDTYFELIKRGWVSDIIILVQSRDVFLDPKGATSSYMDRITPTLDDFKDTLSESQDIDTIFSKFGEPHDNIGSGIHIYVYELNDLTEIWIGYVDDIWFVKHVDADRNELEELFVKNLENPEDCPISFNSRCITGTVTEIFDVNTVRVDNALFRLALVSPPELDEMGGQEAKEFLESICPAGSDALVDQDDLRPLEHLTGTGRIMAVVYCNGLNLNEELVAYDFEYFDGTYCYTSEFADDPWAKKGCS